MMNVDLRSLIGKLNDQTRNAVEAAAGLCLSRTHYDVEVEHFLIKLLDATDNDLSIILRHYEIDRSRLARDLTDSLDGLKTGNARTPALAPSLVRMLTDAWTLGSVDFGARRIRSGHALVALLSSDELSRLARDASRELGRIPAEELRRDLQKIVASSAEEAGPSVDAAERDSSEGARAAGGATPNLDQYTVDLTDRARSGRIDPVLGRDSEVRQVVDILTRRRQNNPILVGEAGVGKTAVIEGFAMRIANGDVPPVLRNVTIRTLDLALLQAGAGIKGEFENRLKGLIEEVRSAPAPIILFIDEAHTMIGAGGQAGQGDAANLLKPALARGELQCVGASTLNEYRKYIEKDGALERRFQTVAVEPPTEDETIQIIHGLKTHYEDHHKINISDEVILAAVKLSERYITDRFLPDKAIDVIDEAGARARLATQVPPPEVGELKEQLEKLGESKDEAIRDQDFERAAELRDRERDLQKQISDREQSWEEERRTHRPTLTEEDVAFIVSRWTGIPVTRLKEAETARLLNMEEELHKRVVGQDKAITAISRAIRRSRAGLKDPRRPIGSFVFAGPTGVGKTELARALAEFLFADRDALIRVDMSEYMEKFSVSRLIGAPPGYVGYEDSGTLTKAVRHKPYSVVLLDEIEKAHPDVFNILLQVLDEGHLTDNYGRVIDFKNTVVIMTSNLGARDIGKGGGLGFHTATATSQLEVIENKVNEEINRAFNPEFINRLDDTIVFHPLNRDQIGQIVYNLLDEVQRRLGEEELTLKLNDDAVAFIVDHGYNEKFGARPIRRAIQKYLEDPLSEKILLAEFSPGDEIEVGVAEGGEALSFRVPSSSKT